MPALTTPLAYFASAIRGASDARRFFHASWRCHAYYFRFRRRQIFAFHADTPLPRRGFAAFADAFHFLLRHISRFRCQASPDAAFFSDARHSFTAFSFSIIFADMPLLLPAAIFDATIIAAEPHYAPQPLLFFFISSSAISRFAATLSAIRR